MMRKMCLKIIVAVTLGLCAVSCAHVQESPEMKQAKSVEQGLRRVLADNRAAMERQAPFLFDGELFSGGIRILSERNWRIGEWQIHVTENKAIATVKKRYGNGQEFERDVVSVTLDLTQVPAKAEDWKAYREWGSTR